MSQMKLTVTVDDAHVASTAAVAEKLKAHGFVIDRVVPRAGAIFGSAEDDALEAIRAVEGVSEVRQARAFQLPPVDPDVPQ